MSFNNKKFIEIASAINDDNYTYSNEILYAACNGVDIFPSPCGVSNKQIDRLSSVMLLIGRSYAASPERRSGANGGNDGKITFFEALAREIVAHKSYESWREDIITLSKSIYAYDGGQKDLEILVKSHSCVIGLNEMMRDSIQKYDEKSSPEDVRNCISFCTKFLHFAVPHIFYIKDGISWQSIWSIYRKQSPSKLSYDKANNMEMDIPKLEFGEALNKAFPLFACAKENINNVNEQYLYHCKGSYALSCLLKDIELTSQTRQFNGVENIYSMPRLVDSILLNIK